MAPAEQSPMVTKTLAKGLKRGRGRAGNFCVKLNVFTRDRRRRRTSPGSRSKAIRSRPAVRHFTGLAVDAKPTDESFRRMPLTETVGASSGLDRHVLDRSKCRRPKRRTPCRLSGAR